MKSRKSSNTHRAKIERQRLCDYLFVFVCWCVLTQEDRQREGEEGGGIKSQATM